MKPIPNEPGMSWQRYLAVLIDGPVGVDEFRQRIKAMDGRTANVVPKMIQCGVVEVDRVGDHPRVIVRYRLTPTGQAMAKRLGIVKEGER